MATELRKRGVRAWEVAGMLGHRHGGYRRTEIYSKYDPDHLGRAAAAIDAYFKDLQELARKPLTGHAETELRSNSVLAMSPGNPQVFEIMVGAAGIEPATPTMST